jgi:hypothetical protein
VLPIDDRAIERLNTASTGRPDLMVARPALRRTATARNLTLQTRSSNPLARRLVPDPEAATGHAWLVAPPLLVVEWNARREAGAQQRISQQTVARVTMA